MGEAFVDEAVGPLRLVVHGLAPAQESHVKALERLGVPVVETYGVTAAAGLLSSNTFDAPHFNLIGSPLPHVSFRLGAGSLLEYKLSLPAFQEAGLWQETGDVAQMTPFGFVITGRKKHLFTTAGGVTVSPVRLERLFKEHEFVADACIVGDRMPYLAALIVLSQGGQSDYRRDPEAVKEKVQGIVTSVNETLSRFATIKKFVILDKPFSEQDGELLSSGSLNRLKIYESRQSLIEGLYRA
jgi:long-chain acyl-CoA synthetase